MAMNKSIMISGIKTLFRRNWKVEIDSAEIDTTLSYDENVQRLKDKFLGNSREYSDQSERWYR